MQLLATPDLRLQMGDRLTVVGEAQAIRNVEKILGNEVGKKYSIDVYKAVDMCICGILAYRSILNDNKSMKIPDLRDPAQRDQYRNDHACTFEYEAGDQLLPNNSHGVVLPDDAPCFAMMQEKWHEYEKKNF